MVSRRVEKLLDGEGMGLALTGEYQLAIDESIALFEGAAMAAADELAIWGKEAYRADVSRALGARLAKTIRDQVFPDRRGQTSLGPSVVWRTNAPHIIDAFREAQTIRSRSGLFLAIPTEAALQIRAPRVIGSDGRVRRGRSALIGAVENRYGRLRFVYRKGGKPSLLVADNVRTTRAGKFRANVTRRRDGTSHSRLAGRIAVVMFILVPEVRTRKLLGLDGVSDQIAARGFEVFARAFTDVVRRDFASGDNA